uniref:PiggyBac transposable element-derived protein 3-like n=1 Tax=Saccoglossus kowalevskii TaxID=10224 RepID=A0ABM0MK14_SACKO|nr:PREDICTED: piggyBac transposable element-derived protein 3-like [Saccoglossus kowalevskii]
MKKKPSSKKIKALERGQFASRQKGEMVVIVWKDSKLFTVLTTCKEGFRINGERVVRHVKDKTTKKRNTHTLPAPNVIYNYNEYMGGVDRANQLRSYYTSQRQTHKWWKYIFFYLLDTVLTNSWIIFKEITNSKLTHKSFQVQICVSLVVGFSSRKKVLVTSQPTIDSYKGHTLIYGKEHGQCCRLCIKLKRKTRSGGYRKSSCKCRECSISLCRDCFLPYHHIATGKATLCKETQYDAGDQNEARQLWHTSQPRGREKGKGRGTGTGRQARK